MLVLVFKREFFIQVTRCFRHCKTVIKATKSILYHVQRKRAVSKNTRVCSCFCWYCFPNLAKLSTVAREKVRIVLSHRRCPGVMSSRYNVRNRCYCQLLFIPTTSKICFWHRVLAYQNTQLYKWLSRLVAGDNEYSWDYPLLIKSSRTVSESESESAIN